MSAISESASDKQTDMDACLRSHDGQRLHSFIAYQGAAAQKLADFVPGAP